MLLTLRLRANEPLSISLQPVDQTYCKQEDQSQPRHYNKQSNGSADIGLSTTGVAGPGGGSAEKPVGLVYVGLATPRGTKTRRLEIGSANDIVMIVKEDGDRASVVELVFVASGFVLRALGGASATRVPPSGWFLLVCSMGALMVAMAKRFTELSVLGPRAARTRPVMRWYRVSWLRLGQRAVSLGMITAYLLWAAGQAGTVPAGCWPV